MTYTGELIANARDIWKEYYSHPFVRGMIDGSLDRDKFCRYLIQDSIYLVDYAKVYAHTFIKAKDVRVMRMIHEDMGLIHSEEDMMHIRYLAEAGYTEEMALSQPALPGCRDYVNYMLRIASQGTMEEGIMAVLPCALSYYHIGLYCLEEAMKKGTLEGNYFRHWIEEYSGEGYKKIYDHAVKLCELITRDASEKEKARYQEIFNESSRFEIGFWDMAWGCCESHEGE